MFSMDIIKQGEGKGFEKFFFRLKKMEEVSISTMRQMASDTQMMMRQTIGAFKTRQGSASNLEHAINTYTQPMQDGIVIGVGSLNELNNIAPYWALINWGGMVSPLARTVPGAFEPGNRPPLPGYAGTRGGAEKFVHMPQGSSKGHLLFEKESLEGYIKSCQIKADFDVL